MSEGRTRVRVFFSWQSDLPREGNSGAIRSAFRTAADAIERDFNLHLDLADGPGGSGGTEIARALAREIRNCDVFLGDVTIVTPTGATRPSPNPNVMYELGLAAAEVGWDRIVMLFNEGFGRVEDLPFDVRHRTTARYRLRSELRNNDQAQLAQRLEAALREIISDNPRRPRQLAEGDEAEVRRGRDVARLTEYFSDINTTVMEEHLERGPQQRMWLAVQMFDRAHGVLRGSVFRLTDQALEADIRALDEAWERTLAHDEHFRETSSGHLQIFGDKSATPAQRRREDAATLVLETAHRDLRLAWNNLLRRVHHDYAELDLAATDRLAFAGLRGDDEDD